MLLTFFFTFPQFAVYRLTRWDKTPFAGKRPAENRGDIPSSEKLLGSVLLARSRSSECCTAACNNHATADGFFIGLRVKCRGETIDLFGKL